MSAEFPEPRHPSEEPWLLPGIEAADIADSDEHLWSEGDVTTVARRQIFEYGPLLLPSHVDRAYNRPDKIEVVFDSIRYGKPALTEVTEAGRLRVHFDQDTLDSYLYDRLSGVSEYDVMRLYVGSGLIAHMILRRLSLPSLTEPSLRGINDFLSEPQEVSHVVVDYFQQSIDGARDDFDDSQRDLLSQVLIAYNNVDKERRTYANMLRFAMSVMLTPSTSWESDDPGAPSAAQSAITKSTRESLQKFLGQLNKRAILLRDVSLTVTDGLPDEACDKLRPDLFELRKQLLEEVSEFEMAAAFPMSLNEMKRIAAYCR